MNCFRSSEYSVFARHWIVNRIEITWALRIWNIILCLRELQDTGIYYIRSPKSLIFARHWSVSGRGLEESYRLFRCHHDMRLLPVLTGTRYHRRRCWWAKKGRDQGTYGRCHFHVERLATTPVMRIEYSSFLNVQDPLICS